MSRLCALAGNPTFYTNRLLATITFKVVPAPAVHRHWDLAFSSIFIIYIRIILRLVFPYGAIIIWLIFSTLFKRIAATVSSIPVSEEHKNGGSVCVCSTVCNLTQNGVARPPIELTTRPTTQYYTIVDERLFNQCTGFVLITSKCQYGVWLRNNRH